MLSFALILAFCFLNRRTSGFLIVAVGVGLNMLVIGLNQGMPTKDEVHERNGQRGARADRAHGQAPTPGGRRQALGFLGDVITVPGLPNQQFSIGDIVIALGIIDVCFEASRRPRRCGVYLDRAKASG